MEGGVPHTREAKGKPTNPTQTKRRKKPLHAERQPDQKSSKKNHHNKSKTSRWTVERRRESTDEKKQNTKFQAWSIAFHAAKNKQRPWKNAPQGNQKSDKEKKKAIRKGDRCEDQKEQSKGAQKFELDRGETPKHRIAKNV